MGETKQTTTLVHRLQFSEKSTDFKVALYTKDSTFYVRTSQYGDLNIL